MVQIDFKILIIAGILLFLTAAAIFNLLRKLFNRIILGMRFKHARKGEIVAKKYLKKAGFKILSDQFGKKAQMIVDKKMHEYDVRVDFLVEKEDKIGIVEVKTGDIASNPVSVNTRRQLFEYYHIFNVDVLYFFDADKRILQEIDFLNKEDS